MVKEKILIALSDATLSSHIVDELATEGYRPIMVKTGPAALLSMQNDKPDLAIIDLLLPEKNGYDVLNEKTLDRFITKIPVIVVSNSGAAIEMRRIPSTPSIKDYVVRTHVEPNELVQKVNAALGHPFTEPNAPKPLPQKPLGIKILWVEDDKFLGNILVKKFETSGHTVLKATNGEEAFDILNNEIPDVIVLDILLPGMSGFEVLQKVRMNEKFKKIPAMMLSNMNKPSDIEKAKTLGAQKFLVKAAVSLDQIVKEIEQLPKS
jgi:two-component system alkaline phosphatase synthesis response regulator PhoP